MGASESKGPATSQSMEQRQANQNRIIDQSRDLNAFMQLNWASFGSGVSSVCIIITLSVLLFFCWRQNKKANRKQHEARLHEIAVVAGREPGRHHHFFCRRGRPKTEGTGARPLIFQPPWDLYSFRCPAPRALTLYSSHLPYVFCVWVKA